MNQVTTLVTIDLTKPEEMGDVEFFDLRRELFGLIASVNGRELKSPLNVTDDNKIEAYFEISSRFEKTVEDFIFEGLELHKKYNSKIALETIEPLIEPAKRVYLS